ncbi:MAG TPA: type II toxin-antitoxin system Phd/YefM family antitoxin [Verrucomicrobiae bacterium]|jgi:antitoxin (DNA-binding transcriptional repressor) of toxin-antitoxin stability system|nr:type II toxin-antitoxin system Phd/YefM family antitoxin [Verrucomicrobiae bacterium]
MKTASVREVRHDFGRILGWVAEGEEVVITKRRAAVARLVPAVRPKAARVKMPDISARLRKVFGAKILSDEAVRKILDDNRGNY